jgi:hypothetical protein
MIFEKGLEDWGDWGLRKDMKDGKGDNKKPISQTVKGYLNLN